MLSAKLTHYVRRNISLKIPAETGWRLWWRLRGRLWWHGPKWRTESWEVVELWRIDPRSANRRQHWESETSTNQIHVRTANTRTSQDQPAMRTNKPNSSNQRHAYAEALHAVAKCPYSLHSVCRLSTSCSTRHNSSTPSSGESKKPGGDYGGSASL